MSGKERGGKERGGKRREGKERLEVNYLSRSGEADGT
jgi:hypothetical protein